MPCLKQFDVFNSGGAIFAWICFAFIILLPALAVRIADWRQERRATRTVSGKIYVSGKKRQAADKKDDIHFGKTLYAILVGMVYPGVLGSILFEVLPSLASATITLEHLPLIALEFAIITHFCYDYAYISKKYTTGEFHYHPSAYFSDVGIVLLLYFSARTVDIGCWRADLAQINVLFVFLYVIYMVWDLSRREARKIVLIDLLFACLNGVFPFVVRALALPDDVARLSLALMIVTGASVLAITAGPEHGNGAKA